VSTSGGNTDGVGRPTPIHVNAIITRVAEITGETDVRVVGIDGPDNYRYKVKVYAFLPVTATKSNAEDMAITLMNTLPTDPSVSELFVDPVVQASVQLGTATCTDKERNNGETDVDCGRGGSSLCGLCELDKKCRDAGDCISGNCVLGEAQGKRDYYCSEYVPPETDKSNAGTVTEYGMGMVLVLLAMIVYQA
jgi:hypothetical protein